MTTKGAVFTKLLNGFKEFISTNCDPSMVSRMASLDEDTIKILMITQIKPHINDDIYIEKGLSKLEIDLSALSDENKTKLKRYIVAMGDCC